MININAELLPDQLLLDAYVPRPLHKGSCMLTLTLKHSPFTNLAKHKNHAVLNTPCRDEFPMDGYHLLGALVRESLLRKGTYSVHSTCIDGHLIVAHSGGGKSSVLLECIQQGMGKVVSGNKTLLCLNEGQMRAIGGTRTMTVGKEAFDQQVNMHIPDVKVYGDRVAFKLNSELYDEMPQSIQAVWMVKLTNEPLKYQEMSKMSALHKLFPFFMDTVNASVVLGEGEAVFQPDDKAAEGKLPGLLFQALKNIQVFEVSGTRQDTAKLIKEGDIK
ncbi:MAG: hypothetical protein OSB62_06485 [Alphaproteobacteria bacterium]|nr:hypothetical protein [Alphaproteobacteria bacterium]